MTPQDFVNMISKNHISQDFENSHKIVAEGYHLWLLGTDVWYHKQKHGRASLLVVNINESVIGAGAKVTDEDGPTDWLKLFVGEKSQVTL